MKRLCSIILMTVMMIPAAAAYAAKIGSAAGNYYYTDIVTSLWGVPVNSVNIGGVTLIDAESMEHYGFEVNWRPEERVLEIMDNGGRVTDDEAKSGALLDKKSGKTGVVAGKYYNTDIVAKLNGKEIKSYNLGGRTFIAAESMGDYGYSVAWDPYGRKLEIGWVDEPVEAVCEPWSVMLFSGEDDGGEEALEFFYFTAKRDGSVPEGFQIEGSGYREFNNILLARNYAGEITLSFSIYQYVGLNETVSIQEKLRSVISYKYGEYIAEPGSVYGALNGLVRVYLNRERIQVTELQYSQGNGHADYTLVLDAGMDLEKSDVSQVSLFCSAPEGVIDGSL